MSSQTLTTTRPLSTAGADASAQTHRGTAGAVATPLATVLTLGLLFMSSLPDAMVVPVLEELFVARYGVMPGSVHWFMAVNVIGAVLTVGLLTKLRRLTTPGDLLAIAAGANGLFLAAMALPIGFGWSMGLRVIEGAADLLVFAVVFDLIAKSGGASTSGRRLGAAGTVLLLGLAAGAVIGGEIATVQAGYVFFAGAASCLLVAAAAISFRGYFDRLVRSCPVVTRMREGTLRQRRTLLPVVCMGFGDRAVAGLLTTTIPLFFAASIGATPAMRGVLIAIPLVLMALGSWPAGLLADRIGSVRLRLLAGSGYAIACGLLPAAAWFGFSGSLVIVGVLGISGAALMPTALTMADRSGKGSVGMGAFQAAGNVGFLAGILLAGLAVTAFGGEDPSMASYSLIILAFAGGYFLLNMVAVVMSTRRFEERGGAGILPAIGGQ